MLRYPKFTHESAKTVAKSEVKEKNKDAHWYPAEITDTGAEFIDEAALDVVCDEDEIY